MATKTKKSNDKKETKVKAEVKAEVEEVKIDNQGRKLDSLGLPLPVVGGEDPNRVEDQLRTGVKDPRVYCRWIRKDKLDERRRQGYVPISEVPSLRKTVIGSVEKGVGDKGLILCIMSKDMRAAREQAKKNLSDLRMKEIRRKTQKVTVKADGPNAEGKTEKGDASAEITLTAKPGHDLSEVAGKVANGANIK